MSTATTSLNATAFVSFLFATGRSFVVFRMRAPSRATNATSTKPFKNDTQQARTTHTHTYTAPDRLLEETLELKVPHWPRASALQLVNKKQHAIS